MLDDQSYINRFDVDDALGVAAVQWEFLNKGFEASFANTNEIKNVVIAGMGGSALPAVILSSWPGIKVPLQIARDYEVPEFTSENTLFISSSYSGNTEETLAALEAAEAKNAQIVVVAAGGKLADKAKEKSYPIFAIPDGIQPRMATLYFLNAFVKILQPLGLTIDDTEEMEAVSEWLKGEVTNFAKSVPTDQNYAKQIANQLAGKTVIMYSGPKLFPAANKWKICMNENAKNTAWVNQYPEFNHNEFIGWSSHPVDKPFAVVEIRSGLEHERVQKRFEVTERLLSGMRPKPIVVVPKGDSLLQQLAYSIVLGDFVSIYLGILNGLNPTPVALVEKLKEELK